MRVYVSDGARTRDLNIPEAKAVVTQIVGCHADAAYDGMTFGVVCLQGHDQAAEIERLLLDALDQRAWDERQLRCGSPSDFQGDERDVMFLSMVAAPNVTNAAFTTPPYERSFNVAMSRARDQVWLFHSVKMDELSSQCLRRRLLGFFSEPSPHADEPDWPVLRLKAASTRRHATPPEPFESWFELDVALKLWDRGYRVLPQVEAGRYRIDLVLEYDDARLAVECDGDAFHGVDQFQADLSRQRMLERAGWRFVRIPGSRFYADPDREIDGVIRMASEVGILTRAEIESSRPLVQASRIGIQTIQARSRDRAVPAASGIALEESEPSEIQDEEEDVEDTPPRADDDDVEIPTGPFTQYSKALAFPAPDAPTSDVAEAVLKIVAMDGPLPKASIYRVYVQGCPNVARAATTVRRAVNKAIHWLEQAGKLTIVDEGRWRRPKDQVVRLKGTDAFLVRERGVRQPEDIPLSELAERLRQAGALTLKSVRERDAVLREAQRCAGFDRLGASVRQRLEAAWTFLESNS
jgi:very-short-patch-repair endonuclease